MRFLAELVMRGRTTAVMLTVVALLASLKLPPLGYLSGAAVGLVTLRMGLAQGMLVAGLALVASTLLAQLLLGSMLPGVAGFFSLWLPVALAAEQLRRHSSLGRSLWLLMSMAALLLLAFYLQLDDPALWWREWLAKLFETVLQEAPQPPEGDIDALLDELSGLMTGSLAAAMLVSSVLSLLLARWWQALLYNPGGFGEEFRALRLGRGISLALFLLLALSNGFGLAEAAMRELLLPLLALYVLQGLAIVHGLVAARGASVSWLVLLYGLLLFAMPPTALALAMAGWADNWMDFRTLLGGKKTD